MSPIQFQKQLRLQEARRPVIKHAIEGGINFFDTANLYSHSVFLIPISIFCSSFFCQNISYFRMFQVQKYTSGTKSCSYSSP